MNTRRYPRTLNEAFGPYTSHQIEEELEPIHPTDRIVIKACALAAMAFVASLFIWS